MAAYISNPNCQAVQLDDEWMVINGELGTITKLNAMGGLCWTLLREPQTVDSLAHIIKDRCGSGADSIEQELQVFLTDLQGCGLVERAD